MIDIYGAIVIIVTSVAVLVWGTLSGYFDRWNN